MFDVMFTQEGWLFSIPALLGTLVFLLRIVMMSVGHHGGIDMDHAGGGVGDVHAGDITGDAHDSTHSFSLLSVQSIAALMMGFGWGGLTARYALDWPLGYSVLAGIGVGAVMVWLLGMLMKGMYDLQISGNISLSDTVGRQGVVYAGVPQRGSGTGQVRLVVNQRSRIFNAVSESEGIPTNTAVRVTRANDDNTLTVTRAG